MFGKKKHSRKTSLTDSKGLSKDGFFGHPLGEKTIPRVKAFVDECIEFLQKQAVDEPGIFRICGSDLQVREMKKIADKGKLKIKETFDIHNVASLFKMYFREMNEPLLTFDLYEQFISAHLCPPANRNAEIAAVINKLPPINKEIFAKVCFFLNKLAQHKQQNLMDERNLAIVFSPTFLRSRVETPEIIIGDAPHTNGLITTMIENAEFFLGVKTPRTAEHQPKSALTESVCKDRMLRHRQKSMAAIQVMRTRLKEEQKIDDGVINKQLEELSKKIKEGDYHSIEIDKEENSSNTPHSTSNDIPLKAPSGGPTSPGRFLQRKISFQVGVNVTKVPSRPKIPQHLIPQDVKENDKTATAEPTKVEVVPLPEKPVQSPKKGRHESSSEESDSEIFDESIFDKFEQADVEPNELSPEDQEGYNLLQLIIGKIQNPNAKPSNPEEDLQVKMLSLLLTDD